ncbi:MAG: carbohydrate-binding family 9-like protein, partial [Bradymonadia bacterium]
MRMSTVLAIIFITVLGCKEYVDAPLSPSEQKRVDKALQNTNPSPKKSLNVDVEDQIRLLGVDVSPADVEAGSRVVVTMYLKALHRQMEDNRIFLHFQCRGRSNFQNLDGKSITHRLLPLRRLKEGQIVSDRIEFTVHSGCKTGAATLYWGLYRGADRLKFKNAKSGQVSHDGRLKALRLQIKGAQPPILRAIKTNGPALIDGKLTEPFWQTATPISLKRIGGRESFFQSTKIRAVYDDTHLFIGVDAKDSDVSSTFTERDSNTWEQEVIEVFIDAMGSKRDYLELQVTPANVIFDAKFSHHRSDLQKARAWQMNGLVTMVNVDGTLNKRDDRDAGYSIEMKIPLAQVPGGLQGVKRGEWRINFF